MYGGELDVLAGTLTVTHGVVDLGTLTWTLSGLLYSSSIISNKKKGSTDMICENYKVAGTNRTALNNTDDAIAPWNNTTSQNIALRDDTYTDVETLTTALSGVKLVYALQTTTTYTLSAQQITTLLGINNIFADTGAVSVTYPADTKLYIDSQQTEDDMTANANIASGAYFQVGNTLYLATSAIAAGETIVPGTNCNKTTFAAALNAILAGQ